MVKINDIEYASPEEIKRFQESKLREALSYLGANSRYYRRMFERYNINAGKIRCIEDLVNIPFTEKKDLQLFNEDFLCVPKEKVIDYITTSGTLSDPVTFCCTEKDLQRLAFNEKKSFECAGLQPGNILQLMVTLDKRFMAGLAYFLGLRELGASVIRVGNGIPELQWDTIQRIRPDSIMCVPSFIPRLIQYAEDHGIDYQNSSIRKIIGIGESLRNQDFSLNLLGQQIKSKWDVELYATYSSTEMGATFSECEYGVGGHVHPELIIVEILRFRTGDVCAKITEKCPCGRNSYRLTPLVGRKNNMIKLKGTTLYPPALMDVLNNTPFVQNYVIYVQDSQQGTDEVVVKVGLNAEVVAENARFKNHPEEIVNELKNRFRAHVRVAPVVQVASVEEVQRINFPPSARKPVKFVDLRKKDR